MRLSIAIGLTSVACAPTLDEALDSDGVPTAEDRFGPVPMFEDGTQDVVELADGLRWIARTTTTPRPLSYHVVQIDPAAAGLSFEASAPNGDAPRETTRQTTRAFAEERGLTVAINAHFFTPWPAEDDYANVLGLAAHEGEIYSPFEPGWDVGFIIDDAGGAHIVHWDESDAEGHATLPPRTVQEAVGSNEQILTDGVVTGTWEELHPRTAIGVEPDGQVLWLVVDGRQDGVSEGMTTPELAEVLSAFGASNALNLDGGGSSTLVVADPELRVANSPVGYLVPGTERSNGSAIGVRVEVQ